MMNSSAYGIILLMKRDIYAHLIYARPKPIIGKLAYYLLKLLGAEIPVSTKIGKDFLLLHGGYGVVLHPKAVFGNRVRVYPGVTVGRADVQNPIEKSKFEGLVVEDDVILGTGSKILCSDGTLRVGHRTIVGANAVLLQSTGENEIWAGIPAKCVGKRED
jgi:serine O-acetyltransferase